MGIPVLVFPHVLEDKKIKQGDILSIKEACWRKMSVSWASRFPSIKGIPRGYLVLDNPGQVEVLRSDAPVEFHPCTIMEYQSENALLYDYVFCSANSQYRGYRKEMEAFFSAYRLRNGRQGRYLLATDVNDPLFDATYTSPNDLLREADGKAQINLITERIRNAFLYKEETLTTIMQKIPRYYPTNNHIISLAINVDIPPALLQTSSVVRMSAQLVDICREQNKLEELVDQVIKDNGEAVNA
jgi:hypothetical protein